MVHNLLAPIEAFQQVIYLLDSICILYSSWDLVFLIDRHFEWKRPSKKWTRLSVCLNGLLCMSMADFLWPFGERLSLFFGKKKRYKLLKNEIDSKNVFNLLVVDSKFIVISKMSINAKMSLFYSQLGKWIKSHSSL